jgi:hypothetical protein
MMWIIFSSPRPFGREFAGSSPLFAAERLRGDWEVADGFRVRDFAFMDYFTVWHVK